MDEQVKPAEWVLVPRDDDVRSFSDSALPEGMIRAGMAVFDQVAADNANYVAGETTDWDTGMIAVAVYRAMLAASPSPEGTRERGELVERVKAALDLGRQTGADGGLRSRANVYSVLSDCLAALTLPPVPGVDREVVERLENFAWGVSVVTLETQANLKADLRAILALVSPLEGKGSSRASRSAHVASATATEASCDLERYAALGRACEANGLAGYGADIFHGGEAMWFQPPGDLIAEQTAEPLLRALREIAAFASIRASDPPRVFGKVARGALFTISEKAKQAALQSSAPASVAAAERSEAGCAGKETRDAPSLPDSSCKSEGE